MGVMGLISLCKERLECGDQEPGEAKSDVSFGSRGWRWVEFKFDGLRSYENKMKADHSSSSSSILSSVYI